MSLSISSDNLKNVELVGDRVLIKLRTGQEKTKSGLLLPPGVEEKEPVKSGYVVKVGPGYPIPAVNDIDEPWKENRNEVKYVPLQLREGDLAVFLQSSAWEIQFNDEKYFIVPNTSILLFVRDENLYS